MSDQAQKLYGVVAALVSTAEYCTDLENVYNDEDGTVYTWAEVYEQLAILKQASDEGDKS